MLGWLSKKLYSTQLWTPPKTRQNSTGFTAYFSNSHQMVTGKFRGVTGSVSLTDFRFGLLLSLLLYIPWALAQYAT